MRLIEIRNGQRNNFGLKQASPLCVADTERGEGESISEGKIFEKTLDAVRTGSSRRLFRPNKSHLSVLASDYLFPLVSRFVDALRGTVRALKYTKTLPSLNVSSR